MYRDYEEYMRTVLGYNPIYNDGMMNTYSNPYNNMQFKNYQANPLINNQDVKMEEDEYEEIPEVDEKNKNESIKEINNRSEVSSTNNRTYRNNYFRANQRTSQNATSYKNFLRF